MQLINKLLVSVVAISTALLCGCAGRITPLTAQSLTTLAVYEAGHDNPKRTQYMRRVQPAACVISNIKGATLEDVAGAIENASDASAEDKVIINVILSIFQTSTAPQGTNTTQAGPYLKAVFCDGWAGGLALIPPDSPALVGVTKNAIPKKASKNLTGKWILMR